MRLEPAFYHRSAYSPAETGQKTNLVSKGGRLKIETNRSKLGRASVVFFYSEKRFKPPKIKEREREREREKALPVSNPQKVRAWNSGAIKVQLLSHLNVRTLTPG